MNNFETKKERFQAHGTSSLLHKMQLELYQVLRNCRNPEMLMRIFIGKLLITGTHRSTIISNDRNYMLKNFVLYVVVERKKSKSRSKREGSCFYHEQSSVETISGANEALKYHVQQTA
jgi:hypothetical protein